MRKILGFIIVSLMFFVNCGGDVSTPAFAQDTPEDGTVEVGFKSAAISAGATDGKKPVIAVDAGFAGNGTAIGVPTGFTADQCKFTAAAANIGGSSLSTSVSINLSTGEVVCEKLVQERVEIPPETKDCVASYTVICVREDDI